MRHEHYGIIVYKIYKLKVSSLINLADPIFVPAKLACDCG
jgi:hypothetical protein